MKHILEKEFQFSSSELDLSHSNSIFKLNEPLGDFRSGANSSNASLSKRNLRKTRSHLPFYQLGQAGGPEHLNTRMIAGYVDSWVLSHKH